jgi:hypothetical protein
MKNLYQSIMTSDNARSIAIATVATSVLLLILWLLLSEKSIFAIAGQPFTRLFFQAPNAAIIGYLTATGVFSFFLQKNLSGKSRGLKQTIYFFLLFVLLYSVVINFSRDIGFCYSGWFGSADISKSYCRLEKYFSIEHWAVVIFISIMYYSVYLAVLLMTINFGLHRLASKFMSDRFPLKY